MNALNLQNLCSITDYIVLFPVKWYSLVSRVIAKATVYDNVLIITKKQVDKNLQTFLETTDILMQCKMINHKVENKDFYILYFESYELVGIYKNWLNLIVLRACMEKFSDVLHTDVFKDHFIIKVDNINIYTNFSTLMDDGINICIGKNKKENVVSYQFNYFAFICQLEEKFNLLSSSKCV